MGGIDEARKYLGLQEVRDKQKLESLFRSESYNNDLNIDPSEVSWCAAFINACERAAGHQGTGRLNARSFLKYGTDVLNDDWKQGDIVIFKFPSDNDWQGHVTYLDSFNDDNDNISCLGGNQHNEVCISVYSQDYIIGVRRSNVTKD